MATSTMYQKKHDVFSVVSDLFTHSLLQPKFQNKYHFFIFNNPRFVDVTNRRLHRNHIDRTLYDADILAKMFINEFNNDNLISVIDMVKYLNNDFRNKVIMSDTSGLLYHINQLFLLNFDMTYKDDKKSIHSSSVRELNYFLNDGIEFILKYPQVFISVISLSLMVDQEQSFEKIFDYKFNPTNIFYQYTTPRVLFELIRRAKNSKIYFAVLLCSITSCTSGALNSLFAFVLKRYQRINDKMENDMKEIASFFAKVWTMFNNSNSVDEFENKILKAGLYEESYKDVYSKAFLLYVENDKKIDYEETKALVAELNSSLL